MGPPPWIDRTIQSKMSWRDGDVVVSVPAKSGTTWTMNIVHQLREHGDRNFEDVYAEVPWIEVIDRPSRTADDMARKLDAMPAMANRPRAFKTHASPPMLPFHDRVKYVVVARNPEEVVVSMRKFVAKHRQDFHTYWGIERRPEHLNVHWDLREFYEESVVATGMEGRLFRFVEEWWKRRSKPNVLMLHYSDMVNDHDGSIKKISDFLGFGPYTDEQWQTILEVTSFAWMKEHESKFEARTVWEVPILEAGGMVRQGKTGRAMEEQMTEDIAASLRRCGREILTDDAALEWLYNGGDVVLNATPEGAAPLTQCTSAE